MTVLNKEDQNILWETLKEWEATSNVEGIKFTKGELEQIHTLYSQGYKDKEICTIIKKELDEKYSDLKAGPEDDKIVPGEDPYCYPGTNILRNKLGFKDQKALDEAERRLTAVRYCSLNFPILQSQEE